MIKIPSRRHKAKDLVFFMDISFLEVDNKIGIVKTRDLVGQDNFQSLLKFPHGLL